MWLQSLQKIRKQLIKERSMHAFLEASWIRLDKTRRQPPQPPQVKNLNLVKAA